MGSSHLHGRAGAHRAHVVRIPGTGRYSAREKCEDSYHDRRRSGLHRVCRQHQCARHLSVRVVIVDMKFSSLRWKALGSVSMKSPELPNSINSWALHFDGIALVSRNDSRRLWRVHLSSSLSPTNGWSTTPGRANFDGSFGTHLLVSATFLISTPSAVSIPSSST